MKYIDKNLTPAHRSSILKIPEPSSLAESVQAKLNALGVSEHQFRVVEVQRDPETGKAYVIAELSQEIQMLIEKASRVRLHDPNSSDDTPTVAVAGKKVGVVVQDGMTVDDARKWVESHRKRNSEQEPPGR